MSRESSVVARDVDQKRSWRATRKFILRSDEGIEDHGYPFFSRSVMCSDFTIRQPSAYWLFFGTDACQSECTLERKRHGCKALGRDVDCEAEMTTALRIFLGSARRSPNRQTAWITFHAFYVHPPPNDSRLAFFERGCRSVTHVSRREVKEDHFDENFFIAMISG